MRMWEMKEHRKWHVTTRQQKLSHFPKHSAESVVLHYPRLISIVRYVCTKSIATGKNSAEQVESSEHERFRKSFISLSPPERLPVLTFNVFLIDVGVSNLREQFC